MIAVCRQILVAQNQDLLVSMSYVYSCWKISDGLRMFAIEYRDLLLSVL